MIKVNRLENYNVLEKYYVTTCGKVLATGHGKIYGDKGFIVMKPNINKKGYHQYRLFDSEGGSIRPYVHKLVALAYIQNSKNVEQVDHVDMDKNHNYVGNLDWVTNAENMKRRVVIKGFSNQKLSETDVFFIRKNYKKWREGKIWKSNAKEFAEKYNVNAKTITNIASRLSYKHIAEEE